MIRRIQDAVVPGHQTNVQPATIVANSRLSNRDALGVLDGLRPTSGNLAPAEAWRRIVGGRNGFNRDRQNVAKHRRKAILGWLMHNRMYWRCEQLDEWVLVDRISVRHGNGAMIAKRTQRWKSDDLSGSLDTAGRFRRRRFESWDHPTSAWLTENNTTIRMEKSK